MAVHRRPGNRHHLGHGAYVAPDWSADYLHRQSEIVLNRWVRQEGAASYRALPTEQRAALQGRLTELTRRNTYKQPTRLSSTTMQIGIFWIATSWLATGLYIVPQ